MTKRPAQEYVAKDAPYKPHTFTKSTKKESGKGAAEDFSLFYDFLKETDFWSVYVNREQFCVDVSDS
jgi:hypothetical protein